MPQLDYHTHITINPGVRGGKPCVRGMRISAYDVLDWLAQGMTQADIMADYPELSVDDIRACLAYADTREHQLSVIQSN